MPEMRYMGRILWGSWMKRGMAKFGAQDVDVAVALAAIEVTALKSCNGLTIHRGKGDLNPEATCSSRRSLS
jgi:hypothetical protein